MVRDARLCRAPHHEGPRPEEPAAGGPSRSLILRSPPPAGVSKDEATVLTMRDSDLILRSPPPAGVSKDEATALTMRDSDLILRSPPPAGVSKDEATALENALRAVCPFMSAVTVPYSPDGEESRPSQKAGQNSKIQGASARRAADRAGAGGTAQSRDQSRRSRAWLRHRIAAAAGQLERPPL